MKFYARERELGLLERQYSQVHNKSIMTVITGRRRIGKTSLSRIYAQDKKSLYLFVSKKSEVLLCDEFIGRIQQEFDIPVIGDVRRFRDVFRLILEIGKREKIVVIIDEFQEFFHVNTAVYAEIQNLWDEYKNTTEVHLICIGSIYSLMHRIFKNSKEPLFGRADRILYLKPFPPKVIKEILSDYEKYSIHNLFMNYLLTGGVPRYQEILLDNKKYDEEELLDFYFEADSPFIEEGRTILIEEFGKEYGTYFSILELLSAGRTSRSEIESILEKDIGGYLEKLVTDYDLIGKMKPIGAKPTGRIQKYYIKDNFLKFWFRFVYTYRSAIENNNHAFIKRKLEESLSSYSGPILEKLYHEIYRSSGRFNEIGTYWERGNQNEIDLVCIDEIHKKLVIGEIKLNKDKVNLNTLNQKAGNLARKYRGYEIELVGLGLQDIDTVMEENVR